MAMEFSAIYTKKSVGTQSRNTDLHAIYTQQKKLQYKVQYIYIFTSIST